MHGGKQAALIGSRRPRTGSALLSEARSRAEQVDRGIEIGEDLLRHGIGTTHRVGIVRLPVVGIGFVVVGYVAPHAPQLEVIVGAEEERLAFDSHGIGLRDLAGLECTHLFEQADRRVGADHAFVHARPLPVEIILRLIPGPVVQLEVLGLVLVREGRALVGIVAGDARKGPVTGRASPVIVGGVVTVE